MPSIQMSPLEHHIRKRLLHRRKILGYTLVALADLTGKKFQQIQKYETGANRISIDTLYKLSLALAIPMSYWFDGYSPPIAQPNEAHPDAR